MPSVPPSAVPTPKPPASVPSAPQQNSTLSGPAESANCAKARGHHHHASSSVSGTAPASSSLANGLAPPSRPAGGSSSSSASASSSAVRRSGRRFAPLLQVLRIAGALAIVGFIIAALLPLLYSQSLEESDGVSFDAPSVRQEKGSSGGAPRTDAMVSVDDTAITLLSNTVGRQPKAPLRYALKATTPPAKAPSPANSGVPPPAPTTTTITTSASGGEKGAALSSKPPSSSSSNTNNRPLLKRKNSIRPPPISEIPFEVHAPLFSAKCCDSEPSEALTTPFTHPSTPFTDPLGCCGYRPMLQTMLSVYRFTSSQAEEEGGGEKGGGAISKKDSANKKMQLADHMSLPTYRWRLREAIADKASAVTTGGAKNGSSTAGLRVVVSPRLERGGSSGPQKKALSTGGESSGNTDPSRASSAVSLAPLPDPSAVSKYLKGISPALLQALGDAFARYRALTPAEVALGMLRGRSPGRGRREQMEADDADYSTATNSSNGLEGSRYSADAPPIIIPAYGTACVGAADCGDVPKHFAALAHPRAALGYFILVVNSNEDEHVGLAKALHALFPQQFLFLTRRWYKRREVSAERAGRSAARISGEGGGESNKYYAGEEIVAPADGGAASGTFDLRLPSGRTISVPIALPLHDHPSTNEATSGNSAYARRRNSQPEEGSSPSSLASSAVAIGSDPVGRAYPAMGFSQAFNLIINLLYDAHGHGHGHGYHHHGGNTNKDPNTGASHSHSPFSMAPPPFVLLANADYVLTQTGLEAFTDCLYDRLIDAAIVDGEDEGPLTEFWEEERAAAAATATDGAAGTLSSAETSSSSPLFAVAEGQQQRTNFFNGDPIAHFSLAPGGAAFPAADYIGYAPTIRHGGSRFDGSGVDFKERLARHNRGHASQGIGAIDLSYSSSHTAASLGSPDNTINDEEWWKAKRRGGSNGGWRAIATSKAVGEAAADFGMGWDRAAGEAWAAAQLEEGAKNKNGSAAAVGVVPPVPLPWIPQKVNTESSTGASADALRDRHEAWRRGTVSGGVEGGEGRRYPPARLRSVERPTENPPLIIRWESFSMIAYTYYAWKTIGLFHESTYPAFGEDVDLTYTARGQGFRLPTCLWAPDREMRSALFLRSYASRTPEPFFSSFEILPPGAPPPPPPEPKSPLAAPGEYDGELSTALVSARVMEHTIANAMARFYPKARYDYSATGDGDASDARGTLVALADGRLPLPTKVKRLLSALRAAVGVGRGLYADPEEAAVVVRGRMYSSRGHERLRSPLLYTHHTSSSLRKPEIGKALGRRRRHGHTIERWHIFRTRSRRNWGWEVVDYESMHTSPWGLLQMSAGEIYRGFFGSKFDFIPLTDADGWRYLRELRAAGGGNGNATSGVAGVVTAPLSSLSISPSSSSSSVFAFDSNFDDAAFAAAHYEEPALLCAMADAVRRRAAMGANGWHHLPQPQQHKNVHSKSNSNADANELCDVNAARAVLQRLAAALSHVPLGRSSHYIDLQERRCLISGGGPYDAASARAPGSNGRGNLCALNRERSFGFLREVGALVG